MNNRSFRQMLVPAIGVILVAILLLLWWGNRADPEREPAQGTVGQAGSGEPGVSPTDTIEGPTPTTYPCPQATPELFQVDPVTSPTDMTSQIITVQLGLAETITVTSEAGTVAVPAAYQTNVEIPLLPGTVHNLVVSGQVQTVQTGDCTYGGYILTTTSDRYGSPLMIEQTGD